MQTQYDDAIVINPTTTPNASVIWLHGLGADAHDFTNIVGALDLPEKMAVRFIFPNAPMRKITINEGREMRGWFDIHALDLEAPQDKLGMKESIAILEQLIAQEMALGIPSNRIILAGFSQGAAVAMHTALSSNYTFAGVLALSGFLLHKMLPTSINNKNTPILMLHGQYDDLIPLEWAKSSKDLLVKLGLNAELLIYPMEHNVCEQEIREITQWLQNVLRHE